MPICTDGHNKFSCTKCGESFLFSSGLKAHINIKSLIIQYFCRYCGISFEFSNICQSLSHIWSHKMKIAIINTGDMAQLIPVTTSLMDENAVNGGKIIKHSKYPCFECNEDIAVIGIIEKDRVQHYMRNKATLECPVCKFKLPSPCALIAHLRIHLKVPPFICCECGKQLSLQNSTYPYNHDCEGFKMMKVTSRMSCFNKTCAAIIDPSNYLEHLKTCHSNKIYKCPKCYLNDYNEKAVVEHMMLCCNKTEYPLSYFECQACPGVLFDCKSKMYTHLEEHSFIQQGHDRQIFPCWDCGLFMHNVYDFLRHHVTEHYSFATENILIKVIKKVKHLVCGACLQKFWYWQKYYEKPSKCFSCIQKETSQTAIVEESSKTVLEKTVKEENLSLEENQCDVCREKFSDANTFGRHYRVHGLAFLMKNSQRS